MVSAEVALVPATGEADGAAAAAPKPVVGAFTVDGLTFAVVGPSQVELVEARVTAPTLDAEALSGPMAPVEPASLVLPEAVEHDGVAYALASIGDEAFANAAVEVVGLPATVMAVDEGAFRGSLVQRVEVDPASECLASYDGALYSADLTRLLSIPGGRLGTVRISDKAEEVPASVFSHCTSVDAVEVDAGSAAYSSRNGCLYDASGTLLWAPPGSAEAAALAVPSAEASADAEGADGEGLVEGIPDSGATGDGSDGMEGLSAVQPSILDSFAAMGDGITTVADGLPAAGADGDGDGLPAASLGEAAASRNRYDLTLNAGGGTIYVTDKALTTLSSPSSSNLTVECGCTSMRVRLLPGYPGAIHFQHGADHSNNQYRLWVRPGYKVTGFRDVANSGDYALTESWLGMAGKARTLEPTWSPQTYFLTVNANGGTMASSLTPSFAAQTVRFSFREGMRVSDIGAAGTAQRSGYRLAGWRVKADGANVEGEAIHTEGGSSVHYLPSDPFASSEAFDIAVARGQSITMEAQWDKVVGLSWDSCGGSAVAATEQVVPQGIGATAPETVVLPAQPTRAGYRFAGWFTAKSGGTQVSALTPLPSSDTTYYAQWEEIPKVIVEGNGGKLNVVVERATERNGANRVQVTKGTVGSWTLEGPAEVYNNRLNTWYHAPDGFWYFTQVTMQDRAGYKRTHWKSDDGSVNVPWNAADSTMASYPKGTVRAVWKQHPVYTLYPNGNGAKVNGSTGTYALSAFITDYTLYPNGQLHYRTIKDGPVSMVKAERVGYSFAGWATSATGVGMTSSKSSGTDATNGQNGFTYYATWKPISYTIAYNANGGSGSMGNSSATYDQGVTVSKCTFTAPSMKRFMGWNTKADGTGTSVSGSTAGSTAYSGNLTTSANATVTLYAQWVNDGVIVDMNGGVAEVVNCDAAGERSFFNLATSDAVIFSKEYHNAWLNQGGSENIRIKSVSRPGWRHVGWSTDRNCSVANATSITWRQSTLGNVTVYAVWEALATVDMQGGTARVVNCDAAGDQQRFQLSTTYSVYFYDVGGAWVNSGGDGSGRISGVWRDGYRFRGWSTDPKCAPSIASSYTWYVKDGAVTLYGIWEAILTVDMQGGTAQVVNCDAAGDQQRFQLAATHAVNFSDGGGAWVNSGGDGSVRVNGVWRTGYRFCGWSTDAKCAAKDAGAYQWLRADGPKTLYAIWSPILTIDLNGGKATVGKTGQEVATYAVDETMGNVDGLTLHEGGTSWYFLGEPLLSVRKDSRPGYAFYGWAAKADAKEGGTINYHVSEGPTTVYAVWRPILTADMQGGTVRLLANSSAVGTATWSSYSGYDFYPSGDIWNTTGDHLASGPQRTGYRFSGYSRDKAGEPSASSLRVSVTEPTTVYAIWSPITYSVRFDPAGGSWDGALWEDATLSNPLKVAYDADLVMAAAPKRPGRAFCGWRLGDGASAGQAGDVYEAGQHCARPNFASREGAEIVLTAIWANVYSIEVPMEVGLSVSAEYGLDEPALVVTEGQGTFRSKTPVEVLIVGVEDDEELLDGAQETFGDALDRAFLTMRVADGSSGDAPVAGALAATGAAPGATTHRLGFGGVLADGAGLTGLRLGAWAGSGDPTTLEVAYGLDVSGLAVEEVKPWVEGGIAHLTYTFAFADEVTPTA